jgi:hypothetical protein
MSPFGVDCDMARSTGYSRHFDNWADRLMAHIQEADLITTAKTLEEAATGEDNHRRPIR